MAELTEHQRQIAVEGLKIIIEDGLNVNIPRGQTPFDLSPETRQKLSRAWDAIELARKVPYFPKELILKYHKQYDAKISQTSP